jgi:hypothetical protein
LAPHLRDNHFAETVLFWQRVLVLLGTLSGSIRLHVVGAAFDRSGNSSCNSSFTTTA